MSKRLISLFAVLCTYTDVFAINCSPYTDQALVISAKDRALHQWEIDIARNICSKHALDAFTTLTTDQTYFQEFVKWAPFVNTPYAAAAVEVVVDERYEAWEVEYAAKISNPFAFQVFVFMQRYDYWQSALKWVPDYDNIFATQAAEIILSGRYESWQIKWAAQIDTLREFEAFQNLRLRPYSEAELIALATAERRP